MRGDRYLKIARRARSRRLVNRFALGADSTTDERAMGFTSSPYYTNFCIDKGVLTDGWGIEEYPDFAGITDIASAWEYARYEDGDRKVTLMYCDKGGNVHALKGAFDETIEGKIFTSTPIAIGYRLYGEDVSLICSPTDGMAVYDGSTLRAIEPSPKITGMTLHYERLFVTTADETDSVRFSDDLDPTDWAEGLDSGGFIQLADGYGRSNKAVSFMNYVYIFRDYGISRMIAYADQSEFSVSNLFVSAGRIYAGSVAVCGDRVIFLAGDGLYSFDGLDTTRIAKRLGTVTEFKDSAVGHYFEGKYYLAYSSSGDGNDSLLVYDIASGTAELSSGFTIDSFCGGDSLWAVSNGRAVKITRCGAALGSPTEKVWKVPFGAHSEPDRLKRIEEITLETAKDITLDIRCDRRSIRVNVKGGEGVQTIKVGLRGRKIGLTLTANDIGNNISSLAVITSSE